MRICCQKPIVAKTKPGDLLAWFIPEKCVTQFRSGLLADSEATNLYYVEFRKDSWGWTV
jgi:hypothetical protein